MGFFVIVVCFFVCFFWGGVVVVAVVVVLCVIFNVMFVCRQDLLNCQFSNKLSCFVFHQSTMANFCQRFHCLTSYITVKMCSYVFMDGASLFSLCSLRV